MTPINEVIAKFAYEPYDNITRIYMEDYLNSRYPQAKWIVRMDSGEVKIHYTFKSETEKTFFLIKWS